MSEKFLEELPVRKAAGAGITLAGLANSHVVVDQALARSAQIHS
jgi:hypothetical protein